MNSFPESTYLYSVLKTSPIPHFQSGSLSPFVTASKHGIQIMAQTQNVTIIDDAYLPWPPTCCSDEYVDIPRNIVVYLESYTVISSPMVINYEFLGT